MEWLIDAVFRPAQYIGERLAAARTVGNVDWWTDLPDSPEPLARLKDGLKRANSELENLPSDVADAVRDVQRIVNGSMYAVRPLDEVIYYARSDIGQAGIRGQQAVVRHAMPPKPLVPFPFPEVGLPPSLLADFRAGIAPAVTPKQGKGTGGAGSTPTAAKPDEGDEDAEPTATMKGGIMASLTDERLRRLHKRFCDAAEEYPALRFAAVTSRGPARFRLHWSPRTCS
jgi:hypothetical protein